MKRYLIYVAVGPLLGGFWLLLTTTIMSGYWSQPMTAALVGKLLKVFFTTLQYSYLFGFLPALMIGAIDDILSHVRPIAPVVRMLLVGLSNVDADRQRNIQLLKERSWFDVPLVYTNQRRAIIAIEKGAPGERAFNDAFAAWGE